MKINENQSRTMYAFFVLLFTVNLGYTIWNFHESRRLRLLQQQIAEQQLRNIKNGKKNEDESLVE